MPLQALVLIWLSLAAVAALDTWRNRSARRPGWLHRVAFHGGIDDRVDGPLEGGHLLALTGGIRLDLSGAQAAGDEVFLRATAVMGGIDIHVPDHWRVEMQASAALGGVANHTDPSGAPGADAPVLRVEALAVMGGVRVVSGSAGADGDEAD